MPIIEVNYLTKEYQLGHLTSLKETALNTLRRLTFRPVQKREQFKALDNINFHIEEGEVVGIIGHNGAGKSTLLKHLANISKPTKGEVIVRGSVAPLIEVGAGVNPELTGRENIFLNAAILGIPKKIVRQKLDEIIDFSNLEQFIDTPVKRYSSGMTVKLGFSIATSMDADILIIDEVLAVGDLAFQRKCFDRMEDMIKRQGKTVLLVSHNIRQVQRLCSRVILLDHGQIDTDGEPKTVCDMFYEKNDREIKTNIDHAQSSAIGSGEIELVDIHFLDQLGHRVNCLTYDQNCSIHFRIHVLQELENVTFGFGFHTTDFLYLTTHNSEEQLSISTIPPGNHEISCQVNRLPLLPGIYSIRFGITAGQAAGTIFYGESLKHFQVIGKIPITIRDGFFALDANWCSDNIKDCQMIDFNSKETQKL
ncbi:ABC transporter ATP-binding protein [Methylicorpusculum sp.]|uniref:ABC transporter ATP-binding protein n=2 Tax=Methylicorpusculum sp. TaxID=2713644 RepID=UPI002727CB7A|nr:ABC transporter ATP-binding protein [Methylicorpusculum sp.]MDO8845978.1 ABC transporter ATP-binding protein [Methylicorpusculum sp.]MDP2177107.1 ABC transporter ATP-binding protein [Methylicorpusculum sp.]MDP3531249.1 ABC transporter ATP-binding protein [Methylicorpusculum sp.]